MALENLDRAEINRYQRHLVIPEIGMGGQQKLKAAKVLVVGAGGLGSPVLLYLAAAGIGTLGIADGDTVSESNLQRQILFTTADVGKSKAFLAEQRLLALNPFTRIVVLNEAVTKENVLEVIAPYDIIVDATDNFLTRYLLNDACVLAGKPLVYGSIYRFEGQVSVFNAIAKEGDRSPHYRDLYPVPGASPNCAESGVIGVLPGIVGSMQANEVIKLVTGVGETLAGRLLLYDALTAESRIIRYRKNPKVAAITELKVEADASCLVDEKVNDEKNMKEITVEQLKELRDSGADFQLIDVREPHEFEIANLGGELIPLGQVDVQKDKISKDKQVVIHCRSGARSGNAVTFLEQKYGYNNLYNLKGGILAWSDQIDPTVPKY
ncbi:molybdopterin-synthase adenylyltransferase MoeB [Adhaeribacter aquaticus]|uniref:molybdopterin-synthase adenylyltransferase MoeB n=1 Tax=Adhaeribacter aquaticus TaxID=299567 RepID=UPI000400FAB2|nr:molybdopterin-synthase adenylyltransferase MoeB [Adhaeribacter aquaticus]